MERTSHSPEPLRRLDDADHARSLVKRCKRCEAVKPLRCFRPGSPCGRTRPWCRDCERIAMTLYRQTERYQEARAAYLARPEVIEARKGHEERRRESRKARRKEYSQTLRGRMLHARAEARRRLQRATDPASIERLARTLALHDAAIERLNREMDDPT